MAAPLRQPTTAANSGSLPPAAAAASSPSSRPAAISPVMTLRALYARCADGAALPRLLPFADSFGASQAVSPSNQENIAVAAKDQPFEFIKASSRSSGNDLDGTGGDEGALSTPKPPRQGSFGCQPGMRRLGALAGAYSQERDEAVGNNTPDHPPALSSIGGGDGSHGTTVGNNPYAVVARSVAHSNRCASAGAHHFLPVTRAQSARTVSSLQPQAHAAAAVALTPITKSHSHDSEIGTRRDIPLNPYAAHRPTRLSGSNSHTGRGPSPSTTQLTLPQVITSAATTQTNNETLPPTPEIAAVDACPTSESVDSGHMDTVASSSSRRFSSSLETFSASGNTASGATHPLTPEVVSGNAGCVPMRIPFPPASGTAGVSPSIRPQRQAHLRVASWIPMSPESAIETTSQAEHVISVSPSNPLIVAPQTALSSAGETRLNIDDFLDLPSSVSPATTAEKEMATSWEVGNMSAVSKVSSDHNESVTEVVSRIAIVKKPLTVTYMWLLFCAYVRVRLFVMKWRGSRKKNVAVRSTRDQMTELIEAFDSNNWLHVYTVEWLERNHAPSSTASANNNNMSVSPVPEYFTHDKHLTAVGLLDDGDASQSRSRWGGLRQRKYEPATLHLSASHLYLASTHATTSRTIRYTEIAKVNIRKGGLEILISGEQESDDDSDDDGDDDSTPSSRAPASYIGGSLVPSALPPPTLMSTVIMVNGQNPLGDSDNSQTGPDLKSKSGMSSSSTSALGAFSGALLKSTPSGYFTAEAREATMTKLRAASPSFQQSTSRLGGNSGAHKKIIVRCKDASSIITTVTELQTKFLRGMSMSLAERIVLRSQTKTLNIVHFNDVYHLPPFKPANARGVVGGAGRFHTVLAKLRETTNPLVLFSGDFMGPSLMSVITKGKQMIDAFNFLGVHYGCFGNHEFDFGLRTLKEVVHGYTQGKHIYTGSQTTWIMSNMTESDGTPLGNVKPYAVCVWNGVRVGLLGLCENWLPQCANLHPSEARYMDMFECGERLALYLKETEGVDVVIALTHNRNAMDRELALRCPTIDFILGGHDHKFKSEPKFRFLKSGQEFEYLSTIEVVIAPGKKPKYRIDCTPITFDIQESDYLKGLITRYDLKMAEKLGRTIGKTEVALDSTEETVRFKEGHLTNFILDVIQSRMEAEIAFLGAAAISGKEVKPAGYVTLGDVFGWFPNETKIMTMRLKGSTIKKTLDVMVRELPAEAPSFPHPSQQLRFTINMFRKPPICEDIFVNGYPLDMDRSYLCAVEDFVGTGKAKYKHVALEGDVVLSEDDAVQVVTLVRDYFLKRTASAVDAKEAGALKNVTKIVSSATHIGVDMDMAKSQRFIRSLICELLHCNRSAIFLVDDATNEIHFVPDGSEKEIRMSKEKGFAGFCATHNELLNIEDAYEDQRFNRAIDVATGYRTKTVLCCPVLLDGLHCSAVVQAINKDDNAVFDEIDEITLRVLGEQVSYQLRYQAIFQEAKAELQFAMGWVLDILRSMTSDVTLDLSAALKAIATHGMNCFRCDIVRVYKVEADTNQVRYVEEGLDDETVIVTADLHPSSLVAELAKGGESRVIKDASKRTLVSPTDNSTHRNIFGIPLISFAGAVVGVILLCDKPRGFTADDESVAKYFGRLSAVSIENSIRLSRIMTASTETTLPSVPLLPLNRIRVKGGWTTIRVVYRYAKACRREAAKTGVPIPPIAIFFGSADETQPSSSITITLENSGVLEGSSKESHHRKNTRFAQLWVHGLDSVKRGSTSVSAASGSVSQHLHPLQMFGSAFPPTPMNGAIAGRKRSSVTNLFVDCEEEASHERRVSHQQFALLRGSPLVSQILPVIDVVDTEKL